MGEGREFFVRNYLKEEEFLDKYHLSGYAAAELLGEDWYPNSDANDDTRQGHKYFLSTGQLQNLVFDAASVYHDEAGCFSSVQILLKSSKRVVNVRVRRVGNEFVAEKILDKPA